MTDEHARTPPATPSSPLAPLRLRVFRMLWGTWLVANVCMWMNDVAAAWLMTSLTHAPLWVALVQTAATLPVFLLGLPSGALADIVNRKHFLLFTQLWVAVVALILSAVVFLGAISPPLLLALTFANGIGLAMRWPVFAALVPELVPRQHLPAALALNGVSMNASRILGPLIAGALIASAGSAWVFLLNAVLSVIAALVLTRWQRPHRPHPLGRETLGGAIRVGVQFVAHSSHLQGALLRIGLFIFNSTALTALLPLLARGLQGGGAGTFTLLLACMGAGAIAAALTMPWLRHRWPGRDRRVLGGVMLQSFAMAVMAVAPNAWLAAPAMLLFGMAWMTTANSIGVSAQMGLPDWVRARGMSIYQMALMGSGALGAALWGQVASLSSVQLSVLIAAGSGVLCMALAVRLLPERDPEDLTPAQLASPPQAAAPGEGQILISIEYRIDPKRADGFRAVMEDTRHSRLRHGALSWTLLRDLGEPGRYVEQIVEASWTDHLRRFDRATAADVALRDRRLAFHLGEEPPVITRSVIEPTGSD